MEELNIFNGFGIKPTNTHVSAGMDFYIPHVNIENKEVYDRAVSAICKSFKITEYIYYRIVNAFGDKVGITSYMFDIVHFYLCLSSKGFVKDFSSDATIKESVEYFCNKHLVFHDSNVPGLKLFCNDAVLINSGIKVALPHMTAGIFLNKSGMGNRGFDVRAQVVDEDYSGYVHLSVAYTKDNFECIYAGDKLSQFVIFPILHLEPTEITENVYNDIMKDSARGSDGFGSSDVKR